MSKGLLSADANVLKQHIATAIAVFFMGIPPTLFGRGTVQDHIFEITFFGSPLNDPLKTEKPARWQAFQILTKARLVLQFGYSEYPC
jgi:hypothetical protein